MPKQSTKITLICPQCGRVFQTYGCWTKRRAGTPCCSPACARAAKVIPAADLLTIHSSQAPGAACRLWTGPTHPNGYGRVGHNGRYVGAHVLAWEVASGAPVPKGMVVCHTCDTPLCTRNDEQGTWEVQGRLLPRWGHLFLGTHGDNIADRTQKGRSASGDRNGARVHLAARPRGETSYQRRHPEWIRRGDQIGTAKLTDYIVLEIRQRYAGGSMSQNALAEMYGVSQATIYNVVRLKRWQHV